MADSDEVLAELLFFDDKDSIIDPYLVRPERPEDLVVILDVDNDRENTGKNTLGSQIFLPIRFIFFSIILLYRCHLMTNQ
jgi:hypothetical protein